MDKYGDKVQLVFRDFPLSFHNNAQVAAEAGNCAHEQDKFWAYHDKLFQNQTSLTKDNLKSWAAELELDSAAFNTCLDSGKFKADIAKDQAEGQSYGVTGTPAFFINGRFINGAQPFTAFESIIEEELAM
jgi:protein-disulfide isomerase